MLGFPCAYCGFIEFIHQTDEISDALYGDGMTPYEYLPIEQEEVLRIEMSDFRSDAEHKLGYSVYQYGRK